MHVGPKVAALELWPAVAAVGDVRRKSASVGNRVGSDMLVDLSAACLSAMREALRLSDVVLGCLPGWSDEARKQSQNFLVCAGCAASVRCEAQVCAVCCVLCVVAGVRSDQEALWLFNCSGGVHGAI